MIHIINFCVFFACLVFYPDIASSQQYRDNKSYNSSAKTLVQYGYNRDQIRVQAYLNSFQIGNEQAEDYKAKTGRTIHRTTSLVTMEDYFLYGPLSDYNQCLIERFGHEWFVSLPKRLNPHVSQFKQLCRQGRFTAAKSVAANEYYAKRLFSPNEIRYIERCELTHPDLAGLGIAVDRFQTGEELCQKVGR